MKLFMSMSFRNIKYLSHALLTLLLMITLPPISIAKDNTAVTRSLTMLQNSDPQKDFDQNIKNNDLRFVGIYGFTVIVPGVDEYRKEYSKTYGLRMIEGTSDSITSPNVEKLNRLATDYAKKYNALLVQYVAKKQKIFK